jgi:hypothetical protein
MPFLPLIFLYSPTWLLVPLHVTRCQQNTVTQYSYTCTPPVGLHGLFYGEFYLLIKTHGHDH